MRCLFRCALGAALLLVAAAATARPPEDPPGPTATGEPEAPRTPAEVPAPADEVLAALDDATLQQLVAEALERSPELAAIRERARAARQQAPQVGSLPDPVAATTYFLASPETRVGPQQLMLSLSQRLPWLGKLSLREQAALAAAAAVRAELEAVRLEILTEVRRLYHELAFLDAWRAIIESDRSTLEHYEELARTRYASGVGLEQAVIKIQAEITKDETRLLDIADRRAAVVARLNALRDRSQESPVGPVEPGRPAEPDLSRRLLREAALRHRPEVARARARVLEQGYLEELARKEVLPDLTVGLTYTRVGDREDPAGRVAPPPDNGDDVLGIRASVNIPLWRERIRAGAEQAAHRRREAEEGKRGVITTIERELAELTERLELTGRELRLYEDVLAIQAEESLSSAEAAYSAGNVGALDLLDAERVLLEVRTATARTRADLHVTVAQLEGVVGAPLGRLAARSEAAVHGGAAQRPASGRPVIAPPKEGTKR